MFFRKSNLITRLRTEIAHLREVLAGMTGERDAYKKMAHDAIEVAQEKHFPEYTCSECGTVAAGAYFCPKCQAVLPAHFAPTQRQRDEKHKAQLERIEREYSTEPSPNWTIIDCPQCQAPVGRLKQEFPTACPMCGTEVDILDAGEIE